MWKLLLQYARGIQLINLKKCISGSQCVASLDSKTVYEKENTYTATFMIIKLNKCNWFRFLIAHTHVKIIHLQKFLKKKNKLERVYIQRYNWSLHVEICDMKKVQFFKYNGRLNEIILCPISRSKIIMSWNEIKW